MTWKAIGLALGNVAVGVATFAAFATGHPWYGGTLLLVNGWISFKIREDLIRADVVRELNEMR